MPDASPFAGESQCERVPPQDLQVETALLGSMLIEGDAANLALSLVRPGDFYSTNHRRLFEALSEIVHRGQAPDELLLGDLLKTEGTLEELGGSKYIHALASSVPSAANMEEYAKIIVEHSRRRNLIIVATQLLNDAQGTMLVEEARARHEQRLRALDGAKQEWASLHDILEEIVDLDYRGEEFFKTGLFSLDYATGGLYQGINVISGVAGAGKTTLALQTALRVAQAGHEIGIFSGDQSVQKLARKMWSCYARAEKDKLKDDANWVEGFCKLQELPIHFSIGPMDGMAMLSKMRMKAARGCKWFVIDYLGLVQMPGKEKKHDKKEDFAELLRALASELKLWIILIAKCVKPGDGPPKQYWVEGAAGVANAPDQIWWAEQETQRTVLHILKAREAKAGHCYLDFQGALNRYDDMPGGL